VSAAAGLIGKRKRKSSMFPLDGELFDAAEDIRTREDKQFLFLVDNALM
jgi:hypothetical protein